MHMDSENDHYTLIEQSLPNRVYIIAYSILVLVLLITGEGNQACYPIKSN